MGAIILRKRKVGSTAYNAQIPITREKKLCIVRRKPLIEDKPLPLGWKNSRSQMRLSARPRRRDRHFLETRLIATPQKPQEDRTHQGAGSRRYQGLRYRRPAMRRHPLTRHHRTRADLGFRPQAANANQADAPASEAPVWLCRCCGSELHLQLKGRRPQLCGRLSHANKLT